MDGETALRGLRAFVEARAYRGYDPYDALNSPLVRALTLGTRCGRLAWTQLFRRLPINLRPVFGVRRGHNPKAIGLFLWGYAKLHALDRQAAHLRTIDRLLSLLDELRSQNCSGNAWGYNFDWQSRVAFVPRWTPTIVNSSFVGHALLDAYRHTGRQRALQMAVSIKDFLLNDLNRKVEGDAFCFSYTPVDENYVHNANLLAASLLIRLAHETGERSPRDAALASLAYGMKHQHDDGSWFYAESPRQRWIDSFHTGFNLQAIRYILDHGEALEHREAYAKGVSYYAKAFFLDDGTPKYYHDRVYPIDIHAPTQAIVFFSGMGERYAELTGRLLGWMLANLHDQRRGCFHFRKGRILTNTIPYMRWSQAWAFHALTEHHLCGAQRG